MDNCKVGFGLELGFIVFRMQTTCELGFLDLIVGFPIFQHIYVVRSSGIWCEGSGYNSYRAWVRSAGHTFSPPAATLQ